MYSSQHPNIGSCGWGVLRKVIISWFNRIVWNVLIEKSCTHIACAIWCDAMLTCSLSKGCSSVTSSKVLSLAAIFWVSDFCLCWVWFLAFLYSLFIRLNTLADWSLEHRMLNCRRLFTSPNHYSSRSSFTHTPWLVLIWPAFSHFVRDASISE